MPKGACRRAGAPERRRERLSGGERVSSSRGGMCALRARDEGLPFRMEFLCPAAWGKSLLFGMEFLCPAVRGKGVFLGMRFFVPCGHGGLFFYLVLAACAAGGKAGPVMGLRPLLGPPCIPPEAPPWAFHIPPILKFPSALTPNKSVGLSRFRQSARAARLLLRELPSLRSGDLPARRAMP